MTMSRSCFPIKPRQAVLLACALVFSVAPAFAACTAGVVLENVAETTPSADFVDPQNGTVIHLKTGLIWKRCAEGQEWNGSSCQGEPIRTSWSGGLQLSAQSSFAGATDWRVPNRKELESLIEYCGHSPAINQFQFPPTPSERFWSSTSFVGNPAQAWDVYFSDGYSGLSNKDMASQAVRLVRTAPAGSLRTPQQISFGALPILSVGGSAALSVSASSGLPVILSSATSSICTVSGATVSGLVAGQCSILADQAGDGEFYPAAQVSVNLTVGKQSQQISFGNLPTLSVGATASVPVTATSGLPVSLSSPTSSVCTIAGTAVTAVAAGSCTVTASQAGNELYLAAPVISANIAVGTSGGGYSGDDPAPIFDYPQSLSAGWHLLGNSLKVPIKVASRFKNAQKIESVWKWVPAANAWAFYSPMLTAPQLQAYLASKSFQPLTEIAPGEAYWLKLRADHDFGEQSGSPVELPFGFIVAGWNLITLGEAMTPEQLNSALAATPPAAGTVAQSFVSLWAWDAASERWLFYAPALEAAGPGKLKEYTDAKGYLDFSTVQKKIGKGVGFWIRK